MLTQDQIDLIHQEIDGVNSPEASAAVQSLVDHNEEAAALFTELRSVSTLLSRLAEREPNPAMKAAILEAHAAEAARSKSVLVSPMAFFRWLVLPLQAAGRRMEEAMATKKALIIGTSVVAVIAIIGSVALDYPPTGGEAGTIGGVQQANRYRGREMSPEDVTVSNPEIATLFQNHEVVTLVKSEVFREAMSNEAFRSLQSNEAYRELMSSDAYRELMSSDAYRSLQASDAYRSMQANEAFRSLQANEALRAAQSSEAFRALQASDAYRSLQANDAFRAVMANDAFRAVMANDAFRAVMASDAYRAVMANDAFRAVMANDAFRAVMANDAYRSLQSAEVFRAVSRSAQLSEVFMNQAMRVAQ